MEENTVKTKFFFLVFIMILSAQVNADDTNDTKDASINLFTYDQYGKVLLMKEVKIVKNLIFIDGAQLSPIEMTVKSKYFAELMKLKKSDIKTCSEGKYILRRNYNGQDSIETGCLSSKRFVEINNHFHNLRKDVVLK